jgi:acetyltransferase
VDYLVEQAEIRGLKFDNIFSMGNSAQYGVEDIIEMLDETHGPDNALIKLIYMETVKKPQKLLKHARSLTRKGCILIGIKSGVTDSGKRAAASHTGALASSDTAVQALFDKAGIIRVRSKYELVELACALECLKGATTARNVAIITDAGGPGVMLTDELNKSGVMTPALKASTQLKIAENLPKFATFINPVDCLPTQTAQQIAHVIQSIEDEKEDIDAVVVITGNSMLTDKWETYATIIDCMEKRSIAVLPLLSSVTTCRDLIDKFISHDKAYFVDEVKIGEALGKLHNRPTLYEPESSLANYDKEKLTGILGDVKGVLPADKCTKLLDAAGLGRPGQITVTKIEDLSAAAASLKFPLVAKIIGPLHKSDVGGVIVGINNEDELTAAWKRLEQIEGFEGVLLQEMVGGNEIIIGAKREEGYGHLVLFGLGGIYTEVFKDSQFALAPLGLKESENIIRSIRAVKMLEGVRGQKGMSITKLADQFTRISMLVRDFPQISEIDLNPVKGEGEDLSVVDCRIII